MVADNLNYFADHLKITGLRIPRVQTGLTAPTVLTTSLMPGKPLDLWLEDNPGQDARDRVAGRLNALVVNGLYKLGVIHADPNPGNFIIADDLTIGLVDFGCIKRLAPDFAEQYRKLVLAAAHQDDEGHFQLMIETGLIPADLDRPTHKKIKAVSDAVRQWFGRLFAEEVFDFRANPGFIAKGKSVMRQYQSLHRHLRVNPDFIFLDRTRYGLLRIFEMMGARVDFRNPYEW